MESGSLKTHTDKNQRASLQTVCFFSYVDCMSYLFFITIWYTLFILSNLNIVIKNVTKVFCNISLSMSL